MSLLSELTHAKASLSRSISAENPTGEPSGGGRATTGTGAAAARELGVGWKVSPSVELAPHSTTTLADITGQGAIKHIWMTCFPAHWRSLVLEFTWDDAALPGVRVPYGDFFCNGWNTRCNINSLPVAVNPAGGMNCYWEMPFLSHATIKIVNLGDEALPLYYQIDYALEAIASPCLYFQAYWHRSHPLAAKAVHPVLPQIEGTGHFVGTYLAYQSNSAGWWGEGEMKFYLDADREFPTICGTGTEDYFGGAWNFEQPQGQYGRYSTAFLGLPQVIQPDGLYQSQQRFGLYRWHVLDPIRFTTGLRVTLQSLGWRSGGRYLPQQDDIASTAFFYLDRPDCASLEPRLDADWLEVN